MPEDDRLQLLLAEAKRVERSARLMKQLAAQAIDAMAAEDDSQEAHVERHEDEDRLEGQAHPH